MGDGEFRAGFCAIVGLPNVGKSTLLNRLTGYRLAAVTPKAQTTRRRLRGIYTDATHQAVFVDTPGLLEPRYSLQEAMRAEAMEVLEGADLVLYVVDVGYEPSIEAAARTDIPEAGPAILCLNKADLVSREEVDRLSAEFAGGDWDEVSTTVATEGRGVDRLRDAVLHRLPPSPPLYPPDQIAVAKMRYFVEEFVRETCMEELEEEVPYSVAVEVEEYREESEPLYISASLYVERSSQKGIVIGEGGSMIRRIGTRSREKVERFVERRVYLDLRVKVLPKWRKRRDKLARLGFHLPKGNG